MADSIEAKDLTKYYADFLAVDYVSFEVKQDEIFGFLGPNGAGKTTTTKMLTGQTKPSSGTFIVAGLKDLEKVGQFGDKFKLHVRSTSDAIPLIVDFVKEIAALTRLKSEKDMPRHHSQQCIKTRKIISKRKECADAPKIRKFPMLAGTMIRI